MNYLDYLILSSPVTYPLALYLIMRLVRLKIGVKYAVVLGVVASVLPLWLMVDRYKSCATGCGELGDQLVDIFIYFIVPIVVLTCAALTAANLKYMSER